MDERGVGLIGALLEQRYRVDALLARGGMSSVYRGLDTRLDRRVAIKVMDARFADDRAFVDRFEREARSAAKIHHPNVVAVHDQGVDKSPNGDLVYLVMELVDGGTLRDLINERGALDVPTALAIMEPVLSALAAAHRAGLVHRDVKPENVLIGHGGEGGSTVKVGDFGLVRAIHSAGTTSASVILGTVAYLSPEQVTTGNANSAGDVYSAGIVLFEALTGTAPYTGDNAISVAYRHVNDDVPAPSTLAGNIPPELDDLVVRATRRDMEQRPVDGAAFLSEIEKLRMVIGAPRVPVPVPAPTIADRTMPVSPETIRHSSGVIDTSEAERTVRNAPVVSPAVAPVAPAGATIVRQAPPGGFRPIGPQGTRAMLRTDLDRAGPATEYVPPVSGPFPSQQPQAAPPRPPRNRPPQPPPARKGRGGSIALWSAVAVLVLALVGTSTWWFASGRYRTVPDVAAMARDDAERKLRDNDLDPQIKTERHNTIAAGTVIRTDPAQGQEVLRGDSVTMVVSLGKPKVPEVREGADPTEVEDLIRKQGLQPDRDDGQNRYDDDVEKGKVVSVSPQPGTELNIGERVVIVLSKGPEPKPIPDVRNKTRDEAFQELTALGYTPVEGTAEFSADVEGGRVIRTDPEIGSKIEGDDKTVTVIVSNAVTVPDLGNQSADQAVATLQQLGLQAEIQAFGGGSGRVIGQSPTANSKVAPNSKVVIWVIP
ncbi:Stk1 family PASTA domain-containing Ser/Thr kinase [Actinophytocola algeriensis]|uniref:non-specific serine/threonine protein kinase n=1 Tax=Actinophytocola algeriensis TaxID=1768010 RepID=A0A7W7Q0Y2_9PSEU|nr:PASTA domain-containing protein [Actinophytocola algeriensis]MBB4904818.1 serine/threonine-protein kinase [Actinophytocola algeriensis]MBE1476323.1 serine/threonine-protein kinase [Actinophytocola algeriensis]